MAPCADLTPGDGQDLLSRFKQAWERRDVDQMMALFREDAEFRPDPFEPALIGELAIRGWWNDLAAGQAHVEFDAERLWVSGTTVLSSWHAAVTDRATSQRDPPPRVPDRGAGRFDAGRTVREWMVSRTVGVDSRFRAAAEDVDGQGAAHGD